MRRRKTAIVAFIFVIVVVMAGSLFLNFVIHSDSSNPPNFEVISKELNTAQEGLDRVAYVSATLKNKGGPGNMTVYVNVIQGDEAWMQSQSVYLNSGESQDLTFKFNLHQIWPSEMSAGKSPIKSEVQIPVRGFSYDVWTEPQS